MFVFNFSFAMLARANIEQPARVAIVANQLDALALACAHLGSYSVVLRMGPIRALLFQ